MPTQDLKKTDNINRHANMEGENLESVYSKQMTGKC